MLNWLHTWSTHPYLAARVQRWMWLITAAAFAALTAMNAFQASSSMEEIAHSPGVAIGAAQVFINLLLVGLSVGVGRTSSWMNRFAIFTLVQQVLIWNLLGAIAAAVLWRSLRYSTQPLEDSEPPLPPAAIIGAFVFLGLATGLVVVAQGHLFFS